MTYLILVRHGQSEGNAQKFFAGQLDIPLSFVGEEQARSAGERLKDYSFHAAFSSELQRAWRTQEIILETLGVVVPRVRTRALNEKHFGRFQGKPFSDLEPYIGEQWYGDLDAAMPGGESARDIEARVVPYYSAHIDPLLRTGRNVLVAGHQHSLLALIRHLEKRTDYVTLGNAELRIYDMDEQAHVLRVRSL